MKKVFIETYIYDEKTPNKVFFPLLKGLSSFQKWGMWLRSKRKVYVPHIYTVSFGGITIGGVGKTPAVIERAEKELKDGKKVCIISRGYGAQKYRGLLIGSCQGRNVWIRRYQSEVDKSPISETAFPWSKVYKILGDELTLALYRLKNVTVIKDPNRIRAVKWAEQQGFDVVILDDAYQYLMLGRNENILLISALNPWGNGFIFPAGILREPLDAIHRATEIWITHCDQVPREKLMKINAFIDKMGFKKTIRWTCHKPLCWCQRNHDQVLPLDYFKEKEVDVFCAIGSPKSFLNLLEQLQVRVKNAYIYRDHSPFPKKILKGGRIILTTEKNLLTLEEEHEGVYALRIGLSDYQWD